MMNTKFSLVMALLLAVFGCEQSSPPEPQQQDSRPRFSIAVPAEVQKPLAEIMKEYGEQQGVKVDVVPQDGSLAIAKCLKKGAGCEFDGAMLASEIWLSRVDGPALGENSQSIMQTPLVFAVSEDQVGVTFADGSPLAKRQSVSALDIEYLVNQGKLKLAVPKALSSNGGFMFLVNYSLALSDNPNRVTAANLLGGKAKAAATKFYSKVTVPGGSGAVAEALATGKEGINAAVLYEAGVLRLNSENPGKFRLFYLNPAPYANYPFLFVPKLANSGAFDKAAFFQGLQGYLLSSKVQTALMDSGYRPSSLELQGKDLPPMVFNNAWGVSQNSGVKPMKLPTTATISEIIQVYTGGWRKPLLLVFALDVSGSMESDGRIAKLKSAMTAILSRDSTTGTKIPIQEGDQILLVAFSGVVESTKEATGKNAEQSLLPYVQALETGGGTDIYAGLVEGVKWLASRNVARDNAMSMVVLTDGASEGSIDSVKQALADNNLSGKVAIHAVATGEADVKQMQQIAKSFNGVFIDSGDLSGLGEALQNAALDSM